MQFEKSIGDYCTTFWAYIGKASSKRFKVTDLFRDILMDTKAGILSIQDGSELCLIVTDLCGNPGYSDVIRYHSTPEVVSQSKFTFDFDTLGAARDFECWIRETIAKADVITIEEIYNKIGADLSWYFNSSTMGWTSDSLDITVYRVKNDTFAVTLSKPHQL